MMNDTKFIGATLSLVTRSFTSVGVVGAGQMGSGIAQVVATHGMNVILLDQNKEALDRASASIASSLNRLRRKGLFGGTDVDETVTRIRTVTDMEALSETEFAIEAATEKFEVKAKIFKALDNVGCLWTLSKSILCSELYSRDLTICNN